MMTEVKIKSCIIDALARAVRQERQTIIVRHQPEQLTSAKEKRLALMKASLRRVDGIKITKW